ncbi:MAG: GtrA family protein [Pseudomonadota bacterium]
MQWNKPIGFLDKRFVSFVLFGGLNTAVTYLLYLALSNSLHYQLAYLIAYGIGIVIAYVLNSRWVFNVASSARKILCYPLIYLVQYLFGAGLMYLFLKVFSLPNALAPLLVIILLLPISFYMNKRILSIKQPINGSEKT